MDAGIKSGHDKLSQLPHRRRNHHQAAGDHGGIENGGMDVAKPESTA
jgi:hypothetical protein